ncbi:Ldh family oxidoreductase, partial [Rhodobacteraceae bacterium R_SAG2]|nr:Ldh family oxidoreductase [Rhodobacteraceae bacterium R_SAG2]
DLLSKILEHEGCSSDEARIVAEHLVDASARGHDSHGVVRISRYVQWLRSGKINANRSVKIIADCGALVQLDGQSGMGQRLAREAIEIAIARARTHGTGIIALRHAGHIGRLGAYAEQAAAAGLVSLHFANVGGSRIVAPFGSAEAACSTAPIALGVPNVEGDDFILDFATSIVAEGKALVAARGGAPLPSEALVGPDGKRTSDPEVLYGETLNRQVPDPRAGAGALRTMGDHKGSGLALACELLAGALTGNGTNKAGDGVFGNGYLAIIIDPARLDDTGGFGAEVRAYIDFVHACRPEVGVDCVLTPGDPERASLKDSMRHGLSVPPGVMTAILGLAGEVGLDVDSLAHRDVV